MSAAPDPALERACRIVAEKDAQPLRRALFARKAALTPAIRAALATWRRIEGTPAATAFVAAYGARAYADVRLPMHDGAIWTMHEYDNEARQLDALAALVPQIEMARVTIGARTVDVVPIGELRGALDLLDRYARRADFLIAARVAATIGYYLRLVPALARSRARAVIVSSDTNPSAVALVHAARRLDRRTCFVTHGFVAESPPALAFDLSILDGAAVRDVYTRAGAIDGEVVYRGVEGRSLPLRLAGMHDRGGTLGIFLSILFDPSSVARQIERLRSALHPDRLLVRLHPNRAMRDPRWSRALDLREVLVSDGARSIEQDCATCDLVACGSSSAHLSALKLGVPTIYAEGLDEVGDDYYGFVARRIVPRLSPQTSRASIASFYAEPDWPGRFAYFDAAYPDRQRECDAEVRRALTAIAT
jgi:hypothetical protein